MTAAGVGPLTRPVTSTEPGAHQAVLDLPFSEQGVGTIAGPHVRLRQARRQYHGGPAMPHSPSRRPGLGGLAVVSLMLFTAVPA